eukprot:1585699-Rhodomonas_salina.1
MSDRPLTDAACRWGVGLVRMAQRRREGVLVPRRGTHRLEEGKPLLSSARGVLRGPWRLKIFKPHAAGEGIPFLWWVGLERALLFVLRQIGRHCLRRVGIELFGAWLLVV